ncbi:MAG: hypothetical protein QNJ17_05435 [Desulfocapsaceae bacterium]|nr:hypothetical protein [Desulfocapsaceae bacterium]
MMLAEKYLTENLRKTLNGVQAECGFKLADVIRSGHENPDSNIGAYAGDADCYVKFSALFDPIIAEYHSFPSDSEHRGDIQPLDSLTIPNLDPDNAQILSTRIRVARNIEGVDFPPAITANARLELERRILRVLNNLKGEFAGSYHSLANMTEETQKQLTQSHFLFKKGDRFLDSAGVNRDWPNGRGIFYTSDKTFLVWVNEEDHLRIISMQQGGGLANVYERLRQGLEKINEQVPFARSHRLGYLSSCPTNLGTAMRASVHIKLPRLGQRRDFGKLCNQLQLSVRGIHGEHSKSENGIWDISNKQRLGITEVECIEILYSGLEKLIRLEENG